MLISVGIGIFALRAGEWLGTGRVNLGVVSLNEDLAHPEQSAKQATTDLLRAAVSSDNGQAPAKAWRSLGLAFLVEGRTEEALAAWRQVSGMDREVAMWGTRAERINDWQAAATYYHLASRLNGQLASHRHDEARMHEQLEQWEKARILYHQAAALSEEGDALLSDYLFGEARTARRTGNADLERVRSLLDQAIIEDQFSSAEMRARALYGRAQLLIQLGETDAARTDLGLVIQMQPNNYWAHLNLGRLEWESEHDLDAALQLFTRASKINPEDKWAYRHLAEVYTNSGQDMLARRMLERVLELDPDDEVAGRQLSNEIGTGEPKSTP